MILLVWMTKCQCNFISWYCMLSVNDLIISSRCTMFGFALHPKYLPSVERQFISRGMYPVEFYYQAICAWITRFAQYLHIFPGNMLTVTTYTALDSWRRRLWLSWCDGCCDFKVLQVLLWAVKGPLKSRFCSHSCTCATM